MFIPLLLILLIPQALAAENYYNYIETLPTQMPIEECLSEAYECQKNNQNQKAANIYTSILQRSPNNFKALLNKGKLLHALGKPDDAFAHLSKAIEHLPQNNDDMMSAGNALLQLGNCYFDTHETEKAIATYKKILTISDSLNAVHHNIAFTLAEQAGAYEQSLAHYRIALQTKPNNSETHFCYALSLLATGNLPEGFAEYEWRWKRFKHAPRQFNYPLPGLWTGTQDLKNKRILINVEQGLGDTLMFIRYAQELKKLGAFVIAETQKPLTHLLSLCPFIDEVTPIGSPLPPFDYQIPMINLPMVFKTSLNTIPASIPYLYAHQALVDLWHSRLTENHSFKIGICWRGDVAHGDHKFMPFHYFEQLAQLSGVTVYSLQKNDPASSITPADKAHGTRIQEFHGDFDESHGRFMDTAAVMKNLDLVITVDTSIAHLAGGLGVPTWLILPFPAEWRWLTHGDTTRWYPSMRLFRQKKFGEWNDVFEEVKNGLHEKMK